MPLPTANNSTPDETSFLGLAPFLRMSIAGTDMKPTGERALALAQTHPTVAPLWLNLSLIMQCLNQEALGLTLQAQALSMQRTYTLPARQQPARCRLLLLMQPGNLAANTPLECLLEDSDIELIFHYLIPNTVLPSNLPEHDVLMLAMSDSDDIRAQLLLLEQALAHWPQPVINRPQHIPCVDRESASRLLQNVPGLLMPLTLRASREQLQSVADGAVELNTLLPDCDFPIILRPLGSQGGHDLAKITTPEEIAGYLAHVADAVFFISRFIDYSQADGHFRKIRIALIDSQPHACHMAVSSHWMIHYVNAGMYDAAWKREHELMFFSHFEEFSQRHQGPLRAIAGAIGLDYLCIDCAETASGELLVFEVDHAMVVHAMDTEAQFPYKQIHMKKVKDAFREMLFKRMNHLSAGPVPGAGNTTTP